MANHPAHMPPGMKLALEVMSPAEEADLIALVRSSGISRAHFAEQEGNLRASMSYGWRYDIPLERFVPAEPLPQGFHALAERAARFAGLDAGDFVQYALNGYDPCAILEPHIDMPCWDRVVGVSLGSMATMVMLRQSGGEKEEIAIELPPRSMYLFEGDARHVWAHSMPPVREPRWSITFRNLSEEGFRDRYGMSASVREF